MSVEIRPVRSRRELSTFIKLPWRLYRNEPNWVAPLVSELKKRLDQRKNPFFEHAASAVLPRLPRRTADRSYQRPRRSELQRVPGQQVGPLRLVRVRGRRRGSPCAAGHGRGVVARARARPHGRSDGLHDQRRDRGADRRSRAPSDHSLARGTTAITGACSSRTSASTRRWTCTCGVSTWRVVSRSTPRSGRWPTARVRARNRLPQLPQEGPTGRGHQVPGGLQLRLGAQLGLCAAERGGGAPLRQGSEARPR